MNTNEPYKNGFGYDITFSMNTPHINSGIYLIDGKIPFIIKPNKTKKYDFLILYSSNTENAYCDKGGKSTYAYNSSEKKPATIVSFNRPIGLPFHSTEFLKWIHTQTKYKIGYISDKDMDNYEILKNTKLLIIPGHSEYWTRKARENFDRFIKEGNNSLILSGNTMWWQIRYNEKENQLICYKNYDLDTIINPELKTVTWIDSSLKYPIINSIGLNFDFGGYGKKEDKGWDGFKIINPSSVFLKGTNLKKNDILSIPTDEYDGADLEFTNNNTDVKLVNSNDFYRYELIGYDLGSRKEKSNGSWILMQNKENSGTVINTGSTNWCKNEGMDGKDSKTIKKITINMIDYLMKK